MPTILQNSLSAKPEILVASLSARSLAQSARRAGFRVGTVDFYADQDCCAAAAVSYKLPGPVEQGFDIQSLRSALRSVCDRMQTSPRGLVLGSGFEGRPDIIDALSEDFLVLGNDGPTVKNVNTPDIFFGRLDQLNIPHPEYVPNRPAHATDWLKKQVGGAGGNHISAATSVTKSKSQSANIYFQKKSPGRPISALVLGSGRKAVVLGWSEQWTAPSAKTPMRYGGATQPAHLSAKLTKALKDASIKIATAFHLKGLNSIDFLVEDDEFLVLEVNARPGATLDIFDNDDIRLFDLHIKAVSGDLPDVNLHQTESCGAAIVYAPDETKIPDKFYWPEWSADRPSPGEKIRPNDPICTVIIRNRSQNVTNSHLHRYCIEMLRKLEKTM